MTATAALVDDDPEMRRRLRVLLEQEGVTVLEYEPSRRGASAIDFEIVDLVVTDIVMPECDGFELLRQIQKRAPEVPVIAYSRGVPVYVAAAEKLGALAAVDITSERQVRELVETVRRLAARDPHIAMRGFGGS